MGRMIAGVLKGSGGHRCGSLPSLRGAVQRDVCLAVVGAGMALDVGSCEVDTRSLSPGTEERVRRRHTWCAAGFGRGRGGNRSSRPVLSTP
jgi:hypothetical protein